VTATIYIYIVILLYTIVTCINNQLVFRWCDCNFKNYVTFIALKSSIAIDYMSSALSDLLNFNIYTWWTNSKWENASVWLWNFDKDTKNDISRKNAQYLHDFLQVIICMTPLTLAWRLTYVRLGCVAKTTSIN
jgi:hypothetical protein